jgi:hypothetical protein
MPDDITDAEIKLHKLAEKLDQKWKEIHPVSQETMEKVQAVIKEQWEQEQKIQKDIEQTRIEAEKASQKQQSQDQQHNQDQNQQHGHSY